MRSRLSALLLAGSALWVACQLPAWGYADISSDEAYGMLVSDPTVFLLDVRTASEYESGHIGGAVHIVNYELASRIGELPSNRSILILVYCLSGGRSATSAGLIDGEGYSRVFNMADGFSGWRARGYPVVVGPEPGVYQAGEVGSALLWAGMILYCLRARRRRTVAAEDGWRGPQ